MKAVGIIPVRLESTRLHEKAIADICGLPMFVHTCKRAELAETLDEVFLATDSDLIAELASQYNIKVIMTSTSHKNSTERIAEACENIDCKIVYHIHVLVDINGNPKFSLHLLLFSILYGIRFLVLSTYAFSFWNIGQRGNCMKFAVYN